MQQQDLFGETVEKKIIRMERWVCRLQKELWFLKEVHLLAEARNRMKEAPLSSKVHQIDMFAGNS